MIAVGGIITVWAVANAQKQNAPKFTITFKADEQIVKTIETSGNEIISLPIAPNKSGFTFEGWFFDQNIWSNELTANYYENIALENNVTVYAYYKKIEATKIFSKF